MNCLFQPRSQGFVQEQRTSEPRYQRICIRYSTLSLSADLTDFWVIRSKTCHPVSAEVCGMVNRAILIASLAYYSLRYTGYAQTFGAPCCGELRTMASAPGFRDVGGSRTYLADFESIDHGTQPPYCTRCYCSDQRQYLYIKGHMYRMKG